MLKTYICPDCGMAVGDGSTACIRCGCPMQQIREGRKTRVKLPYTQWAGQNDVKSAPRDAFGNPNGSNYDLLRDGSMKGYKILLINLCPSWDACGKRESYQGPVRALEGKGFTVNYTAQFPENFAAATQDVCQVWLISGNKRTLTDANIRDLKHFYDQGRGLYLWADNDPFFADVNAVLRAWFGSRMQGDYRGDRVIGVQEGRGAGIVAGHLISTGIANFYEGITISNVTLTGPLKPLVYSSDNNVVTAYADEGGKRLLVDGGFSRLCNKWNSAGTDRYVVNAAGWLGNFEKFGWRIPE